MIQINNIRGHDLNLLYNGIKPNAVVKLPNI